MLASELLACSRAAEAHPKNYYAWTHAQWCVGHLDGAAALSAELERAARWNSKHIGDHCGFHHRQCLVRRCLARFVRGAPGTAAFGALLRERVLGESNDAESQSQQQPLPIPAFDRAVLLGADDSRGDVGAELLAAEFTYAARLEAVFDGHEALWMYRRSLFYLATQLLEKRRSSDGEELRGARLMALLDEEGRFAHWAIERFKDCDERTRSLAFSYVRFTTEFAASLIASMAEGGGLPPPFEAELQRVRTRAAEKWPLRVERGAVCI